MGAHRREEYVDIRDHGFRGEEFTEDMYMFGASKFADRPVLMPGGHGWEQYKPEPELQFRGRFDSKNCSNYGTHNALETLAAFHDFGDFPKNCSERYSGVGTGTTQDGNTPHKVIEIIRKDIGVIPEALLPFSDDIDSWEKYYSPNPMRRDLLDEGKGVLLRYEIGHDWVFKGGIVAENQERLKEALSRGTVAVSVLAWKWHVFPDGETRYRKNPGEGDTHWVQLLDYIEGDYWLVYDHYDKVLKKLDWDYDFGFAKVYYLDRAVQAAVDSTSFLSSIIEWIKKWRARA